MKKTKRYNQVRFAVEILKEASRVFRQQVDPDEQHTAEYSLKVDVDNAEWHHDSLEEFFADYRRATGTSYYIEKRGYDNKLDMTLFVVKTGVSTSIWTAVEVQSLDRSKIESVFEIFEDNLEVSQIPEEPRPLSPPSPPRELPNVFIGHGNNPIWRDLKDHLHEQHNYNVIAYEVGARAGHEIRDILADMLQASSFAILVMTGEDRTEGGQLQPRMNVVHELGLFQGRLGFNRAITLLEAGTQEFSNINGVHQIRFSGGNIRETFGDVVATLNREFPGDADEQGEREAGAR